MTSNLHPDNFIIPRELESLLAAALRRQIGDALTSNRVANVKATVAADRIPGYCRDWAAFAYLYYFSNLAKAYSAAHYLFSSESFALRRIKMVDLGCGGGASTAGVALAARHRGLPIDHVIAIDRCSHQLDLWKATCMRWLAQISPDTKVTIIKDDVIHYLNNTNNKRRSNLIVASYVACELSTFEKELFRKSLLKAARSMRAQFIVIDSDHPRAPTAMETLSGISELDCSKTRIELPLLLDLGLVIPPKYGNSSTTPMETVGVT